jgi:UrcA family protein
METKMIKVLDAVSAIGALVMAATPLLAIGGVAHAQTLQPQAIQVADLDLNSPADMARFDARVSQAANHMCNDRVDLMARNNCVAAIREEATEKLQALRDHGLQSAQAPAGQTTLADASR